MTSLVETQGKLIVVFKIFLLIFILAGLFHSGNCLVPRNSTIDVKFKDQKQLYKQFYGHKVPVPHPHSKLNDNAMYQYILRESFTPPRHQKLNKLIRTVSKLTSHSRTGTGYEEHGRYVPFEDKVDIIFVFEQAQVDYKAVFAMWSHAVRRYEIIIVCVDELKDMELPAWMYDFELYTVDNLFQSLKDLPIDEAHKNHILINADWTSRSQLRNWANWISKKQFTYVVDNDFDLKRYPDLPTTGSQSSEYYIDYLLMSIMTPAVVMHSTRKFNMEREQLRTAGLFYINVRKPEHQIATGNRTHGGVGGRGGGGGEDGMDEQEAHQSQQQGGGGGGGGGAGGAGARHGKYISVTMPYGHILPINSVDFMPDRKLLGAAQILYEDKFSKCDRFNEYTHIVTDWILKVVADHCNLGIKINFPGNHQKGNTNSPSGDDVPQKKKNSENVPDWYEDAYEFFKAVEYKDALKSEGYCIDRVYEYMAKEMSRMMGAKYSCFQSMSDRMIAWVQIWEARHHFLSVVYPLAYRATYAPRLSAKSPLGKCVTFTITNNEKEMLPVWLRYYRRHFDPEDIIIFDHLTTDGSTDPSVFPKDIKLITLEGNTYSMPIIYRSKTVRKYQDKFLRAGYKCVVFGDIDEIIVPDPRVYPDGLRRYLEDFISSSSKVVKVTAYELAHISYGNGTKESIEDPIDWNKNLLKQRKFFRADPEYNKPLISKVPQTYKGGFHKLYDADMDDKVYRDPELIMFHIRSVDQKFCLSRAKSKFNMSLAMEPDELAAGFATHWNNYQAAKKTGELCQFAIGSFLGAYRNDEIARTQVFDNTGKYSLTRLDDVWQNIEL